MKLIREHIIFEKFIEDSDPIKDMGIGISNQYKDWCIKTGHNQYDNYEERLLDCVRAGEYDFVKYLIQNFGLDVNTTPKRTQIGTPIRYAVMNDDIKMIDILLDAGANPNYADYGNFLNYAITKGKVKASKYVYRKIREWNKKHVNEKFVEESDPIQDLGIGTYVQIKDWIFKNNPHYGNYVNEENYQQIFTALIFGEKFDFADFLLKFKGDKINVNDNDCSLLRWAGWQRKFEAAFFLLEKGADLEKAIQHAYDFAEIETLQGLNELKRLIKNGKKN
jgi:ankyrin repeat protein